jgi:Zn-dependent protease with chaperone function
METASGLLARALSEIGPRERWALFGARPETAHLFVVKRVASESFLNLFSARPPIEERVARLRKVAYRAF